MTDVTVADVSTGKARCAARRRDGKPCGGFAGVDSPFCLAHDPARASTIAAARRAGGHARHGRRIGAVGDTPAVNLTTLGDVLALLARAVNDCFQLENSLSRARTLGYLAGVWGDVYESSELERRVAALESAQRGV